MNAQRMFKEARPLFWPWCAVALAGALPLVYPFDWTVLIYLIGFFAVPVMATLSLGDEFQYRTLPLLLSQPVGRMRIWGEKLSVTVVAVLSAVLIFSLALRATSFHPDRQQLALGGAWIVVITSSATFWTLFTRSVVGGIALNIVVQSLLIFIVPWSSIADGLRARGYLAPGKPMVPFTLTFVVLCYAGVMLWLGGRMLGRFQATGGMAGDDLLMAGPDVMPRGWAAWLRCRPSGAILNLIRKELSLLRPVWLISLLAAISWACLTLFGLLYERGFSRNFETAVVIVGVVSTLMIAILAGSMSLGEERTSGAHAWHLTLPVSARLQWCVKLLMALLAGVMGAGLIPMLTIGRVHVLSDQHFGTRWLLLVLVLTFAAFWCGCAANGTVRAVLWVFPALIAVGLASVFGKWTGRELVHVFIARFDPFASFRFTTAVSRLGPNVFFRLADDASNNMTDSLQAALVLTATILVPTLVLAVFQSYRLFRTQLQDRTLSVVRSLLPLAMTAFVCSFPLMAAYTFVSDATTRTWFMRFGIHLPIEEILRRRAIEKSLSSATHSTRTEALQLTVDDLARSYPPRFPFSETVRKERQGWLRNARITVTPDKAHPGGFFCAETPWKSTWCYYSATIHLADGTDLTESYEPLGNQKEAFGQYSIYVHWPGAKGQESLWDR